MQRRNGSGFGRVSVTMTSVTLVLAGLVPACTRGESQQRRALQERQESAAGSATARAESAPPRGDSASAVPHRESGTASHGASVSARASDRTQPCVVSSPPEPPPPAAPAADCPADPTGPPELAWGAVTFVDAPQRPRIRVELAEDDPTRARGLMYRTALEQDQGMLFVFPDQRPRSFWMKNTCIPLDMLFVDRDGTIVGILENVPTLNRAGRGVPCPATYVLEVNAGWTREQGVFAGQRLEIER